LLVELVVTLVVVELVVTLEVAAATESVVELVVIASYDPLQTFLDHPDIATGGEMVTVSCQWNLALTCHTTYNIIINFQVTFYSM
jgi:hypothetical protein